MLWRQLMVPVGVPSSINGCKWLDPRHVDIQILMHTDASSRAWGGQVWVDGQLAIHRAAGCFPEEDLGRHINWKEMWAVIHVFRALIKWRPEAVCARRIHLHIDNTTAQANFRNGGGKSTELQRRHGCCSGWGWSGGGT